MQKPPSQTIVIAAPIQVNISPLGFRHYAAHFLAASSQLPAPSGFSPVPYYLVCRALELGLKAYLLASKVSKQTVKNKLGHNLVRILKHCEDHGLTWFVAVSPTVRAELIKAHNYYGAKGFEYFRVVEAMTGYKDLPNLTVLNEFCSDLLKEIEPICLNA